MMLVFVSLAGCKGGATTGGGDPTTAEFKLNLETGKKFQTSMVMDQEIETTSMGQQMNISQTMGFDFDLEVTEKNAQGNYVLKNTYKRVFMKQSMPGMGGMGDTELDTQDPSKNKGMMATTMAEVFNKFIGKSFDTEHQPNGKIVRTTLNELMTEISGEAGGQMQDYSNYSVAFPDKPVKIGESWESETKQNTEGIEMVTKTKYTLKGIKDGVAEVELDGTIGSNEIAGESGTTGKITGTQKGTSYIDLKTGWVKETKMNQDLNMEIDQMGMKMPMKVKGTITLTTK